MSEGDILLARWMRQWYILGFQSAVMEVGGRSPTATSMFRPMLAIFPLTSVTMSRALRSVTVVTNKGIPMVSQFLDYP